MPSLFATSDPCPSFLLAVIVHQASPFFLFPTTNSIEALLLSLERSSWSVHQRSIEFSWINRFDEQILSIPSNHPNPKAQTMLPSIPKTTIPCFLLLSSLAAAVSLDCENIQVDKKKWDLSKLGGPHSILVQDTEAHPAKSNTTWTIDICAPLKKPKGVPKGDTCPSYTRGKQEP